MFWRRKREEERPPTEEEASNARPGGQLLDDAREAPPVVDIPLPAATASPAQFPDTPSTIEFRTAASEGQEASLESGVQATRRGFVTRLRGVLGGSDLSDDEWEEVEETLIAADVGAERAFRVVVEARRHANRLGPEKAVRAELRALLAERPSAPWQPTAAARPAIILVVGVNGTGKTTTIAKLTARFQREGHTVLLAAADTFRAAAIDQLRAWAGRVGAPVIAHAPGADPSAVVYDALDAALARDVDLLIVDTAGRLHTKNNLMDELAKIRRTISKRLPGVEPEVLFVLDATTGQNGLGQAQAFHAATRLTGLVVTKLDSTARGGIVFAIEQALDVPVRFVGVGERVDDLVDFDPEGFVAALFADPR